MELQSGFVIAVVFAAVLVADRLGGGAGVARRLYQLVLAAAIALAVVGGTTAFIRSPEYTEEEDAVQAGEDFDEEQAREQREQLEFFEDVADRSAVRLMIQFAAGVAAVAVGVLALRRYPTVSLGVALAGFLLVLLGGVTTGQDDVNPLSLYFSALGDAVTSVLGQPSDAVGYIRFAVLAAGALALAAFGVWYWDTPRGAPEAEAKPAA